MHPPIFFRIRFVAVLMLLLHVVPVQADPFDAILNALTTLNTSMGGLNSNMGSIANSFSALNTNVEGILSSFNNATSLVSQFLNPTAMFLTGAAAGGGFALGGIVVSGAAQIVKMTFWAIHEAITHKERNRKILDNFAESRKNYPEAQAAIHKSKHIITSLFQVLQMLDKDDQYTFIQKLNEVIWWQERIVHTYEEIANQLCLQSVHSQLDQQTPSAACEALQTDPHAQLIRQIAGPASRFKDTLDKARLIKKVLESNPEANFCQFAENEIGVYTTAQQDMQNIRATLLDNLGQELWNNGEYEQALKSRNLLLRAADREQTFANYEHKIKYARQLLEKELQRRPEFQKPLRTVWRQCLKARGGQGALAFLTGWTSPDIREKCWLYAYDPALPHATHYTPALLQLLIDHANTVASAGDILHTALTMEPPVYNTKLEQKSRNYNDIFYENLRLEQSSKAHVRRNKELQDFELQLRRYCG